MLFDIDHGVKKQPVSNTAGMECNCCNIYGKQIFSINENL